MSRASETLKFIEEVSVTKKRVIEFGKNPKEGWVIFNAPRPLRGHSEWKKERPNGNFFAAVNPKESNAGTFTDYNLKHGGIQVNYLPEPSMKDAISWWKSGGNKEPVKQKRKDWVLRQYKDHIVLGSK